MEQYLYEALDQLNSNRNIDRVLDEDLKQSLAKVINQLEELKAKGEDILPCIKKAVRGLETAYNSADTKNLKLVLLAAAMGKNTNPITLIKAIKEAQTLGSAFWSILSNTINDYKMEK